MLTYGNVEIGAFESLPEASRNAILTAGVAHICGNVAASTVTSQIRSLLGLPDGPDVGGAIAAWRKANPEDESALKAAALAKVVESLRDGTVGTRSGTPRGTSLDTLVNGYAKADLMVILRKSGVKEWPGFDRKANTPKTIEVEGIGSITGAALLEKWLAVPGKRDAYVKRANAELKASAKSAEAAETGLEALFGQSSN